MSEVTTFPDAGERHGLTTAEVAERVAQGRVNRTVSSPWAEYGDIVRRNVLTLFNGLVAPAAVALFLLGEWKGAIAVSGLAVVNSAAGLVQEIRAKRHLERLALLAEPRVRVRRDGQAQEIPAGELVQDDCVVLTAGEAVVADGPVLTANHLEIDEALLTGESDPVPAEPGRQLLSGSFCVAGTGIYRAERVGDAAYAQQTGREARRYQFAASPLQQSINRLIEILTVIAIVMCGVYVLLRFLRGLSVDELVLMIAATITSMVPQGLVLFSTLAFILGAVRLSARGAVVQRLSAVESMADVNVLCLDKTGTLTSNQLGLELVRIVNPQVSEDEGRGLLRLFAWASLDEQNKAIQALRNGLGEQPGSDTLNNDPRIDSTPARRVSEGGAKNLAYASGWCSKIPHVDFEVLDRLPFKSQNRYSAVRLRLTENGQTVQKLLVLGAFESLRPFLVADLGDAEKAWQELLPTGLRLLLFAQADEPPNGDATPLQGRLPALTLRPLALTGLRDELRPDAAEVLRQLADQKMTFKIISGDHADTVQATLRQLQLPLHTDTVVTGAELAAAADPSQLIAAASIFARVAPRQKVEIVEALQKQGNRVAMVGDGINDILAIKRADLGIALGEGSAATRTVASLVLENNRFALLPETLAEGRNILRNLRRAGKIFILKNVYTLLLIVAALGILGLPFPYKPEQVTLLNRLTIGIPVLVITLSRTTGATAGHAHFLWDIGRFALATGAIIGLAGLAVFWLSARVFGDSPDTQRTMLLSTLIVLALGNLPRVLTAEGERLSRVDWYFLLWLPVAVLLYAAAMYLPWTAYFFDLTPLVPSRWAVVAAASSAGLLVCFGLDRRRPGRG